MKDTKNDKIKKFLKKYIPYLIIIILILLLKKYVVSPIRVTGNSMNTTLKNGDIMILNIIGYRFSDIERFDIVVIDEGDELLIKRIIGLPGEKMEYRNNKLYINGKLIKDKYAYGNTADFSVYVPDDKYFVLGDNREDSLDSRYFGSFEKKQVIGKTNLVLFPFSRFGTYQ